MSDAADVAAALAEVTGGLCDSCIAEKSGLAAERVRRGVSSLALELRVNLARGICSRCGRHSDLASLHMGGSGRPPYPPAPGPE